MTDNYEKFHAGEPCYYRQKRGLIAVWGNEAVQFLNGLITNDVAKLNDGDEMRAGFPNAQGRLVALVRVRRVENTYLFETEEVTHDKVFQNLFRFTFAGDFFVEDRSEQYEFFQTSNFKFQISNSIRFSGAFGTDVFVPKDSVDAFLDELKTQNAFEIDDALYETLRVEKGVALYGRDMDDTTIVPELGIDGVISYNKGCYIGQEIIARIHFRGHVAKELRGLVCEDEKVFPFKPNDELKSVDGKNAGRLTSVAFSPGLGKTIALGYVRWDYLAEDTELKIEQSAVLVKKLPLV